MITNEQLVDLDFWDIKKYTKKFKGVIWHLEIGCQDVSLRYIPSMEEGQQWIFYLKGETWRINIDNVDEIKTLIKIFSEKE